MSSRSGRGRPTRTHADSVTATDEGADTKEETRAASKPDDDATASSTSARRSSSARRTGGSNRAGTGRSTSRAGGRSSGGDGDTSTDDPTADDTSTDDPTGGDTSTDDATTDETTGGDANTHTSLESRESQADFGFGDFDGDDGGHGHDTELDTATGQRPAVRESPPGQRHVSMLQYDDIPVELAEALRNIVNRHELRAGEALPKSISVTSALAGEGVTTVSQALATLIARESGRFVCWIDCSWLTGDDDANENDHGSRPSLIDLLEDRSHIVSAFRSSPDLPQLMSLSPGPVPASKRNMIVRSPEFEHLLGLIRDEFDHVVFDVPPVLSNANGLALLRRSDASLLVVRHRKTSIAQADRAIEATRPTPNLGVVLNDFRTRIPARLRRQLGG